jgi:hypothetical protein
MVGGTRLWQTGEISEPITLRELKAESGSLVATTALCLVRCEGGDQANIITRRQPSYSASPQRDGLRLTPDDGRTTQV